MKSINGFPVFKHGKDRPTGDLNKFPEGQLQGRLCGGEYRGVNSKSVPGAVIESEGCEWLLRYIKQLLKQGEGNLLVFTIQKMTLEPDVYVLR